MRRRKFNMPRAKRMVMGLSGVVLGVWSALSGISAQAAAAPYITFMLGYSPLKAGATASVFAFWTAGAAACGWALATRGSLPLVVAVWTAVGAVLGVLLVSRLATQSASARRLGQGAAIVLSLFVISQGVHPRFGGLPSIPWDMLRTGLGWALTGAVCGAVGHLLVLPTGILLVPGLVYASGLTPGAAIIGALLVAFFAAVLPVVSCVSHGADDREFGPSMHLGGVAGGAMGGWVLARLSPPNATWQLAFFGVTAMLLSAWLAYRSS